MICFVIGQDQEICQNVTKQRLIFTRIKLTAAKPDFQEREARRQGRIFEGERKMVDGAEQVREQINRTRGAAQFLLSLT